MYKGAKVPMKNSAMNQLPNDQIQGVATTKAIKMNASLLQLVEKVSIEQNMTQQQVFENAMIEYISSNGYKDSVD